MLRGRISPLWGKIQNDYYCERHLDRTNRPAHLNGPSFQVQLISCMFDIFLGIWKQRNTIIHDAEVGRIYESAPSSNLQLLPLLYLLDCDYDLVRSKYPLAEAQISVARDLIPFSQIAPQVTRLSTSSSQSSHHRILLENIHNHISRVNTVYSKSQILQHTTSLIHLHSTQRIQLLSVHTTDYLSTLHLKKQQQRFYHN